MNRGQHQEGRRADATIRVPAGTGIARPRDTDQECVYDMRTSADFTPTLRSHATADPKYCKEARPLIGL
ncbi:unnamed protein product [Gadus morhua 'NCC']